MDSTILNPYDEILRSVDHDPTRIQALYEAQRNHRNSESKAKMLSDSFEGMQVDKILVNILKNPDYKDPRNNLCIWARPTASVVGLVARCQSLLQKQSPNIWLTPQDCLHMTTLVIAESPTPEGLAPFARKLKPLLPKLANFHLDCRTRLVKPRLSFNHDGVALSYVPAVSEITDAKIMDAGYTYLHLRRDIFNLCREQGLGVNNQPHPTSCHLTVARFVTEEDHCSNGKPDPVARASWVDAIEKVNRMLVEEYWPRDGSALEAGNWVVGEERGFDIREGAIWYGGGRSLDVGPGL